MTIKRRGNRLYIEVNGSDCHYWIDPHTLGDAIAENLTDTERIIEAPLSEFSSIRICVDMVIEDRLGVSDADLDRKENGVPLV